MTAASSDNSAPPPNRTLSSAAIDATPDALAALACVIAWTHPQVFGFDLLATAGALFFIELPLAILALFFGVRRISARSMSRATKIAFVLLPSFAVAFMAGAVLGLGGVIATLWLSAGSVYRLLAEDQDSRPAIAGAWLLFRKNGYGVAMEMTTTRPTEKDVRGWQWVVPAGHDEVLAMVTVTTWFAAFFLLAFVELPAAAVTAEYASQVGWDDTGLGSKEAPEFALACGLALFAVKTAMHFEGIGDPPAARIDDDPVLREIVSRIDGTAKSSKQSGRRRRKR